MLPPSSHLYPHLRLHQIFGANTDVGKTIFTTALALASSALPLDATSFALSSKGSLDLTKGERVHYVKPISTGPLRDSDSLHISRFHSSADAHTLFQFHDPVSPHVAAARFKAQASTSSLAIQDTSDSSVIHTLSEKLGSFATSSAGRAAVAYVETAGGVHSPAPSGSSFSELLRPLRLPTILIGDSNLGGISTTKSAYDSLLLAGYDVEALLLFSDAGRGWENASYLQSWGREIGLPVWAFAGPSSVSNLWGLPPTRDVPDEEDVVRMRDYYSGLVLGRGKEGAYEDESAHGMVPVLTHLRQKHRRRIEDLTSMAARTMESCWWPFTQHTLAKSDADVNVIDSAYGDFFTVVKPQRDELDKSASIVQPLLDGSASWWTQCLGHADPGLTRAAARAAGRFGHVLFPMCANEPALRLAETLTGKSDVPLDGRQKGTSPGAGWASRVFFSDDGSTGMEVALKMAISSAAARHTPAAQKLSTKERVQHGRQAGYQGGRPVREWKVLGLKGSYHGDTIGAMDACEDNVYNKRVNWYKGRGTWFEPPTVSLEEGKSVVRLPFADEDWSSLRNKLQEVHTYPSLGSIYNMNERLDSDPLTTVYRDLIYSWLDEATRLRGEQYGALVLEPLIMGAGGMICIDPLFQRCLVDVVRENPDLFAQSDPPLRRPTHVRSPSMEECTTSGVWRGLPVIFDEVFTGLYRLGYASPAHALGVNPDISVLAKILTGGMVPMSVTLTTKNIFETFSLSEQKIDALLHGHSYTAHPIGCEVANEALTRIEQMRHDGDWSHAMSDWSAHDGASQPAPWSFWRQSVVEKLSGSKRTESSMALGTVLIVKLRDLSGQSGYTSTAAADLLQELRTTTTLNRDDGLAFNIHARPLGNVIYIMSSLNTPQEVLRKVEDALINSLGA
jgi:dethiobiotin synthetase/adenosylmethionine--8-amino-7-oxononanoate aminotransferase